QAALLGRAAGFARDAGLACGAGALVGAGAVAGAGPVGAIVGGAIAAAGGAIGWMRSRERLARAGDVEICLWDVAGEHVYSERAAGAGSRSRVCVRADPGVQSARARRRRRRQPVRAAARSAAAVRRARSV